MDKPEISEELSKKLFIRVGFPDEISEDGGETLEVSVTEILDEYWEHWYKAMLDKFKTPECVMEAVHPYKLIDVCIMDWCTVNWAVEKEVDDI